MATIDFITSNPALDEFTKQQKEQREQQLADARSALLAGQAQHESIANQFDTEANPTRLRNINSGADLAETNAGVARDTAGAKVRTANAGATTAETDASIGTQTANNRVAQSFTGLRQANATALNTELQGFYKSLDRLDAGDVEGAKEIARQTGQEIPPEVINDAELRGVISKAAKQAQITYPNRPKDQQTYIQSFITETQKRRSEGQSVGDPTVPYNVPGAPTPPEGSAVDSKDHQPADVAIAEWLVKNKVRPDAASAFEYVKQAKANPDAAYTSVYNTTLRANGGDGVEAKKVADAFVATLASRQPAVAPAAASVTPAAPIPGRPVPQPGPAAQRPDMMTPGDGGKPMTSIRPSGEGTRDQPFQAVTQEHIEWFKQNAPAGSVIVVNGVPYTK